MASMKYSRDSWNVNLHSFTKKKHKKNLVFKKNT